MRVEARGGADGEVDGLLRGNSQISETANPPNKGYQIDPSGCANGCKCKENHDFKQVYQDLRKLTIENPNSLRGPSSTLDILSIESRPCSQVNSRLHRVITKIF